MRATSHAKLAISQWIFSYSSLGVGVYYFFNTECDVGINLKSLFFMSVSLLGMTVVIKKTGFDNIAAFLERVVKIIKPDDLTDKILGHKGAMRILSLFFTVALIVIAYVLLNLKEYSSIIENLCKSA